MNPAPNQQYREPQFSEHEQTPAQRWDTVRWAFLASCAPDGLDSKLAQLFKFYVAGDVDLDMVWGELDRLYSPCPGGDAPCSDAPRPVCPPLLLVEEPGRVFPFEAEMAALPPRKRCLQADGNPARMGCC